MGTCTSKQKGIVDNPTRAISEKPLITPATEILNRPSPPYVKQKTYSRIAPVVVGQRRSISGRGGGGDTTYASAGYVYAAGGYDAGGGHHCGGGGGGGGD